MLKEWFRALLGPPGRGSDVEAKLTPYLSDGNACILLRLVLECPGIGRDQLAQRSRIEKAAVDGYLENMAADGLVVVEKEGTGEGCHIAPAAKAAVAGHLPLNYLCPGMMRE